uniref:Uncharacterized protein n=1 Tax=Chromera velia CCMP2878 TaxID=1169474 RepID=A0A0G4HU26_9ALVE|eukprot:Cvel_8575.t1-p1 / transcript=Cvel_8575.t1 / gene=Cvel_8575 / organism=Chromera_velia_CCMP2878 / gene_product=hypothetical protein / transcript_product=hypothetical protein / location=Cvel_scaffold476:12603-15052(-) / protein_length=661 / sequence_SO=supercontig / SO=protein_coding / is_pseudo=false
METPKKPSQAPRTRQTKKLPQLNDRLGPSAQLNDATKPNPGKGKRAPPFDLSDLFSQHSLQNVLGRFDFSAPIVQIDSGERAGSVHLPPDLETRFRLRRSVSPLSFQRHEEGRPLRAVNPHILPQVKEVLASNGFEVDESKTRSFAEGVRLRGEFVNVSASPSLLESLHPCDLAQPNHEPLSPLGHLGKWLAIQVSRLTIPPKKSICTETAAKIWGAAENDESLRDSVRLFVVREKDVQKREHPLVDFLTSCRGTLSGLHDSLLHFLEEERRESSELGDLRSSIALDVLMLRVSGSKERMCGTDSEWEEKVNTFFRTNLSREGEPEVMSDRPCILAVHPESLSLRPWESDRCEGRSSDGGVEKGWKRILVALSVGAAVAVADTAAAFALTKPWGASMDSRNVEAWVSSVAACFFCFSSKREVISATLSALLPLVAASFLSAMGEGSKKDGDLSKDYDSFVGPLEFDPVVSAERQLGQRASVLCLSLACAVWGWMQTMCTCTQSSSASPFAVDPSLFHSSLGLETLSYLFGCPEDRVSLLRHKVPVSPVLLAALPVLVGTALWTVGERRRGKGWATATEILGLLAVQNALHINLWPVFVAVGVLTTLSDTAFFPFSAPFLSTKRREIRVDEATSVSHVDRGEGLLRLVAWLVLIPASILNIG